MARATILGAVLLTVVACGDDTVPDGAGGAGGAGVTSSTSVTPTSSSSSSSTGGGEVDPCGGPCEAGTTCQSCVDETGEDVGHACAPSDPDPGADQIRCGEENCTRRTEVCVEGEYVFEDRTCGEPGRCRALDPACDDCACAVEQIGSSLCVQVCGDDGMGGIYVHGTVGMASGCLNCADPGDPCTEASDCCALDGLGAICNADGVCEETDF